MKQLSTKIPGIGVCVVLALSLLSLFPVPLYADGVKEQEARTAVETWVRYVTADARPDAVVEKMEPYQVNGETVAYIAHLAGGGFCLAGADDLVLPVYLYSPKGKYDPQDPNYQYVLWEIDTRLKALRKGLAKGDPEVLQYQEALSERAALWRELIAGRAPVKEEAMSTSVSEPISMTLNLTSKWHQNTPYNDECPELTPSQDEHTLVGCVATAMAQIMYYWKWPDTGQGQADGDYDYRWTNGDQEPLANDPQIPSDPLWTTRLGWVNADGGRLWIDGYWDDTVYQEAVAITDTKEYQSALDTLWDRLTRESANYSANFGATTYDWSILRDTHTDPPGSGDAEAAKLSYHAGVAVGMSYGFEGSGADGDRIDDALEAHFRYDSDADDSDRDIDKMTEEIQWLRPVALGGSREITTILNSQFGGKVGHEWVVLGYDKGTDPAREFLMNMGWGRPPAWYSCDNVRYPIDQTHVTRIAPRDVVKFVGDDDPGDGSPSDPYEDIEEAISEAPDDATLIFKAGSVNTFSAGTLVIDRPLTLRGKDVTIRK